jgi:hypothetical protein
MEYGLEVAVGEADGEKASEKISAMISSKCGFLLADSTSASATIELFTGRTPICRCRNEFTRQLPEMLVGIANAVAGRHLRALVKHMSKRSLSCRQLRAIIRKNGFSAEFSSGQRQEPLCGFLEVIEASGPGALALGHTCEKGMVEKETSKENIESSHKNDKLWYEVEKSKLNCFASIPNLKTEPLGSFDLRGADAELHEAIISIKSKEFILRLEAPSTNIAQNWYAGVSKLTQPKTKLIRRRRKSSRLIN